MSLWLTEALAFNKTRTPGIFLIFVLGPILQKLMDVLNFTQVNRLMKINQIFPMLKIQQFLFFCRSKAFLCCHKVHFYFYFITFRCFLCYVFCFKLALLEIQCSHCGTGEKKRKHVFETCMAPMKVLVKIALIQGSNKKYIKIANEQAKKYCVMKQLKQHLFPGNEIKVFIIFKKLFQKHLSMYSPFQFASVCFVSNPFTPFSKTYEACNAG